MISSPVSALKSSADHPDVGWDPEMELVGHCVRAELGTGEEAQLGGLVDHGLDWARVLRRARVHGVLGMVYHHLAHQTASVPANVMGEMERLSHRTQAQNLHSVQELNRLAGFFSDADVPLLTFKGPLLAQLYYGNVAFRQFGDIDVLVRRSHLGRARALLEAHGYEIACSLSETEIDRRHEEQLGLEFRHCNTGIVVELHWALLNRTFAFGLTPADVWTRAQTVRIGPAEVQGLAPDDRLLYLCAHGAKHHWSRLLCACDVAQVLRKHPDLMGASVLEKARELGNLRTLLLGLHLTERWLGLTLPQSIRDAVRVDPTVERLVHEIEDQWFGTEEGIQPPANTDTLWFALRTRERLRDSWPMIRHYLRLAVAPTENDRRFVPLDPPAGFGFVHYLVRPVRVLWKGATRMGWALREALTTGGASVRTRSSLVQRGLRLGRRLRRCSGAERRDLAVAFVGAVLVATLLHVCSFQRVLRLVDRWAAGGGTSDDRLDRVDEERLLWAVRAVTHRLLPRRPCLTQALTARLLLGRRGASPTQLQIGVARGAEGTIGAHAWLERDGTVLTGTKASAHRYVTLKKQEDLPEVATTSHEDTFVL